MLSGQHMGEHAPTYGLEFRQGDLTFSGCAPACIHVFLQPSRLTAALVALPCAGACLGCPRRPVPRGLSSRQCVACVAWAGVPVGFVWHTEL